MRISLVVPPFLPGFPHSSRSPAVARSGTIYYPIWLAYGAGSLEKAAGMDSEQTLTRIQAFRPDFIVCDITTPSSDSDLRFAQSAFRIQVTAVGGVHAIAAKDDIAKKFPELIRITSDYDDALPLLCPKLNAS